MHPDKWLADTRNWAKKIQEWRILEKELPDMIFVTDLRFMNRGWVF
ncbi:hypothetical protein Hdeb2414_s0019g00542101 [Helianthus debilis subsp. tardiflorus]